MFSIGGMKSVAWTDAIQGVVFTIVVLLALFVLIKSMPEDLSVVMKKATEIRPGLNSIPGPNKLYTPIMKFTPCYYNWFFCCLASYFL